LKGTLAQLFFCLKSTYKNLTISTSRYLVVIFTINSLSDRAHATMKFFERIENKLQKHNKWDWAKSLQGFECRFISAKRNEAQIEWINEQLVLCCDGFQLVQEEIRLKKELAALEKLEALSADEKKQKEIRETLLGMIDEGCWLHRRVYYDNILNKPKGPHIRRYEASFVDHFLFSEDSKLRCKARGGCCEHDCGCCQRPLETTRVGYSRGHCSPACGCCVSRREFYYTPKSWWTKIDKCDYRARVSA
jgi:hypothetical protein